MAKNSTQFICQKCQWSSPKWSGQCGQCGQWNTLVETVVSTGSSKSLNRQTSKSLPQPVSLKQVGQKKFSRIKSGIEELERVLGGGIVAGSIVLLAGEPGIGKSTLLTQLALALSGKKLSPVLYICGEESPEQIKLRIERLSSPKDPVLNNLLFLPQTDVDIACGVIEQAKPKLAIVDSIQAMTTNDLTGMAGSVGQIRESAFRLQQVAKKTNVAIFLVGHVTKEGEIAGPKVLEHLVDVVLQLEGDKKHDFRILRGRKNRFGPVDEVGIFQMDETGMKQVTNPSDIFLEEKQAAIPGSVVVATMEGSRPVLVEIQALVASTTLAMPRRVANGIDRNRLQMLTAVLTRRCGLNLASWDVYVNVAGGLRIEEPAADLGVCLAIASSFKNKALPAKSAVIGEVGLLGEIRRVGNLKKRAKEARKLGYTKIISPDNFRQVRQVISQFLK
ncbi:DNA repair protein RadA [Patescibacteria group bacterium]|nr:DNA repair protein RadA [Patescibacteria group bacterium]MBU1931846.1 DNA repair protein RadA [Patescibacteria group bacterium]